MLYNTNFLRKEFRSSYTHQTFSYRRQISFGVFLGLLTFALYFSLQTLKESVVNTAAPYLLLPSFFSTLYIYLFISLLFNVWLYIANYEYMTLLEVRQNRWYALVQLGFSPIRMISSKIIGRILAQLVIYTVGFVSTLFLTSFLKFPLVTGYLFTMYLMGALDIVLLAVLSLTMSLYFKDLSNARYMVGLIALGVILFKMFSGYYTVLSDRSLMNDISNMVDFQQTIYITAVWVVIAGCVTLCLWQGMRLARMYNRSMANEVTLLRHKPDGTVVVSAGTKNKKQQRVLEAQTTPGLGRKKWNLPSLVSGILVIIAIACMVVVNVVVLAFGYASPEKETSINGVIPYVFQSHTMEPSIMFNDVAFFRKVDMLEPLNVGDVLLYKDSTDSVNVGQLTSFVTDPDTGEPTGELNTDVIYYADERYRGMAAQTIEREKVYGVHTGNNRWFGAIVLFANTIIGRVIFLLIPTFLIFFYEPITNFFKTVTGEKATEKQGKK